MSEQLTFIPVSEAAKLAGVTKETIRNLCKARTLRYQMRTNLFYVCREDVERYAQSISEVHEVEQTVDEYKKQLNQLSEQLRDEQSDVQARLDAINIYPEKICLINRLLCAIIPHFEKDLNPREIEVALELLQGGRISETAEKLHLTRARVLQIYDKIVHKLEILPIEQSNKDQIISELEQTIKEQSQRIAQMEEKYGVENVPPASENRAILGKPIRDIEFSTRTLAALDRVDIVTVGDLIKYSRKNLSKVRNFGQKSIDEVEAWLAAHDLSLQG